MPAPEGMGATDMSEHLCFDRLRLKNVLRCESVFHAIDKWTPTDWACAMAGETGEACNFIKKMRRLETGADRVPNREARWIELRDETAKELADVVIYADLLAERLGIDLGKAVREKFNEVSRARGSEIFL